jgi:hypothetical protein
MVQPKSLLKQLLSPGQFAELRTGMLTIPSRSDPDVVWKVPTKPGSLVIRIAGGKKTAFCLQASKTLTPEAWIATQVLLLSDETLYCMFANKIEVAV